VINSCHCANHPAVRGIANSTVNISGRKPIAWYMSSGIEVDVRIKLAFHEIVIFQGDALEFERDVEFGTAPCNLEDLTRRSSG